MWIIVILSLSSALLHETEGDLCTLCTCEENTLLCRGMELETIFNATQWEGTIQKITDFQKNNIIHLKQLPQLDITTLILSHNTITKIDDSCFKNLFNLTELDLSHNRLTSEQLSPDIFRVSPKFDIQHL